MRKAGRLSEAAVASVARLNPSVRCMSSDRACPGAPEKPGGRAELHDDGEKCAVLIIAESYLQRSRVHHSVAIIAW